MERKDKNTCIKVDNARFVLHPEARTTLEGVMALISCAIQTGEHKRIQEGMVIILTDIIVSRKKPKGGWDADE